MKNLSDIHALYGAFNDKYNHDIINAKQGGESWFFLKLGVISASNAYRAVAKKDSQTRLGYLHELVAQVCTGQHNEFSSAATDWGSANEDAARATYEMLNDTELKEVPFCFKDSSFREGASPDALDKWGGGVEIKCPYNSVNHIAFAVSDKIKPEYQWQMQFTMRVFDTDHWYFCSFDPRMKKNPLSAKLVARDDDMQKKMDDMLPDFIADMDSLLASLGFSFGDQWRM